MVSDDVFAVVGATDLGGLGEDGEYRSYFPCFLKLLCHQGGPRSSVACGGDAA